MAILSATTMIRALSLFHITLAALLLKNPATLSNQGMVLLVGESMQLPTSREFNQPSAATAFLAVLFALLALSDLTALSLSDELFMELWGNQAPVRVAFLFVLTGYAYSFKEGGMFATRSSHRYNRMNAGASLSNSLIFTWGFFELAAWFWVYVTLRDERQEKARKIIEKRRAEEASL